MLSIRWASQVVVSAILTLFVIWVIKKYQVPVLSNMTNDL